MQKKHQVSAALACVGAVCLLTACGEKAPEPPESYTLGSEQVVSLNTVIGEENSGTLTEMTTPEESADASSSSAAASGEPTCYYAYEKLPTGGETVQKYVEKLTDEDDGFQVVDESGTVTDAPDYTQESGGVALAKTAAEDGKILRIDISWTATDCTITLTCPTGEIGYPPVEPMTYPDAVDYLKGLSSASLGLSGSMSDYVVYPMDGAVMVDGAMCVKLQVYPRPAEGKANAIAGTYLLCGDKSHVYRLLDGGGVAEVALS